MAEIAKRENVTAKISGVVAYADPADWTVETLRPYVEHTILNFGWDRVVWGSDWPVCTLGGGLLSWVAATHALLAGTSNDERARLLSGNARRIWNWPKIAILPEFASKVCGASGDAGGFLRFRYSRTSRYAPFLFSKSTIFDAA